MKTKSDGESAFPHHWVNETDENALSHDGRVVPPGYGVVMSGMTLRDYFAAKALQGLLSSYGNHDLNSYSEFAENAYDAADAMLKARERS